MDRFKSLLAQLVVGETLPESLVETMFTGFIDGTATPAQVAAALTAMRMRGETLTEITAGARTLRRLGQVFDPGCEVMDVCGTGGDGAQTYNISTAVAIVVAAAGVPIAKHGGRAVSSQSGSSQVMERLGVCAEGGVELARAQLAASGMCFLDARRFNPVLQRTAEVRAQLGFRTVFNLLGPLINPAGASRQLLGVYDAAWIEPMAGALGRLGSHRAWVVHGGGLDELSLSGPSQVAEWRDGRVRSFTVQPEDAGLPRTDASGVIGGDEAHNAEALLALLRGRRGPYRDIVVLNCAAALVVAGAAADLPAGARLAALAIDDGAAREVLERLAAVSVRAA